MRSILKHVLLLIFIGWIWQFVWIYRVTRYLNKIPSETTRNPVTKTLLCIFIPFYYIYWTYQSARRIELLAKDAGIEADIVTVSTVLSIFIGIIPPMIMQHTLNQIDRCEKQRRETVPQSIGHTVDPVDEIRKFKKLYDEGIITEEEFNLKKKQLFDL